MSVDPYAEAVKIWIATRASNSKSTMTWAEDITRVEFGEGDYGACPTCASPFVAIEYDVTRNGKTTTHYMDIEGIPVSKIIEECLNIYKTRLSMSRKYMP